MKYIFVFILLNSLAFSQTHPECEECARESNEQLNVLTDASTLAQVNCEVNPYLDEPDNQAMYKNLVRAQKTHEICSTDGAQNKTLEIFWTKEIDCEKESENALTTIANALFYLNYEEPLSFEVKLPIHVNEKALENKLLGPEITSFINPETVERDREHNRQRSLKARKYQNLKSRIANDLKKLENYNLAMDKINKYLCLEYKQKKQVAKLQLPKNCSFDGLPVPKLDCNSKVNGVETLLSLEKIIGSDDDTSNPSETCAIKKQKVTTLFSNLKLSNIDDLALLSFISKNMNSLGQDFMSRHLLGATLESGQGVPKNGGNDNPFEKYSKIAMKPVVNQFHSESVLKMRMAIIGVEQASFQAVGSKGYNDYCQSGAMSDEQRLEVLERTVDGIASFVGSNSLTAKVADQFRSACDKHVAKLFGNSETQSRSCGHGLRGEHRPHEFVNTHIYANEEGTGVGSPIYVPTNNIIKNRNRTPKITAGDQARSNGSYFVHYSKLGIYNRPMSINVNHLGTPVANGSARQTNDTGSIRIGSIGGPGGFDPGSNYNHVHIELVDSRNTSERYNMVDAFCRDIPIVLD